MSTKCAKIVTMSVNHEASHNVDLIAQGIALQAATSEYHEMRQAKIAEMQKAPQTRERYIGAVVLTEGEDSLLDEDDLVEAAFDEEAKEIFNRIVEKDDIAELKGFRLGFIDPGDMNLATLEDQKTHGSFLDHKEYNFSDEDGALVIRIAQHDRTKRTALVPQESDYQVAASAIATLSKVNAQLSQGT
jgi:hypothetical protein